jgi:hypothetical protein
VKSARVATCSPTLPASFRQNGMIAVIASAFISPTSATASSVSDGVKRKMLSPATASVPAVLDWLATSTPLASAKDLSPATSALDCGPITTSTPDALNAVICVSAVAGSSFVSLIDALKRRPLPPSARYWFTSSIPISMAALLATPSDAQLPVSENSPPMTISLSAEGAEGSSLQPAAATVEAMRVETTAIRRERAPGVSIIRCEGRPGAVRRPEFFRIPGGRRSAATR